MYIKYTLSNHILIKLNLWSFLNIKYFLFKSTTFIYYFLSNLSKFKIKFIKTNNYLHFNILLYFNLFFVIFLFICLII